MTRNCFMGIGVDKEPLARIAIDSWSAPVYDGTHPCGITEGFPAFAGWSKRFARHGTPVLCPCPRVRVGLLHALRRQPYLCGFPAPSLSLEMRKAANRTLGPFPAHEHDSISGLALESKDRSR